MDDYRYWLISNEVGSRQYRNENSIKEEELAEFLTTTGLLHHSCIAGQFPSRNQLPSKFFVNANKPVDKLINFMNSFMKYHLLRTKQTTHTSALLKDLIPQSNKPTILCYEFGSLENEGRIIQHSSFIEIRFLISKNIIKEVRQISYETTILSKYIDEFISQVYDMKRNTGKRHFLLDYTTDISKLPNLVKMRNIISRQVDIMVSEYQKDWEFEAYEVTDEYFNSLNKITATKNFYDIIIYLSFIQEVGTIVSYPITYYMNAKPIAEDAIFLFYSSVLGSKHLDDEFSTIFLTNIFDTAEKSLKKGIDKAVRTYSHENSKALKNFENLLSSIKQEPCKSILDRRLYYMNILANQRYSKVQEGTSIETFFKEIFDMCLLIHIDTGVIKKQDQSTWEERSRKNLEDFQNYSITINKNIINAKTIGGGNDILNDGICQIEKMIFAVFLNSLNHWNKRSTLTINVEKINENNQENSRWIRLNVDNEYDPKPEILGSNKPKFSGTRYVVESCLESLENNSYKIFFGVIDDCSLSNNTFRTRIDFLIDNIFSVPQQITKGEIVYD